MSQIQWEARCDRASFVRAQYRCDRKATDSGRCEKHNEPMHMNARKWDEPLPLPRKERRAARAPR